MLNIGRYVFSRAKQENFRSAGNLDSVTQQALRVMRKSTKARNIAAGEMLGEIMVYAVMEEKLNAHKLLSRVELGTDAARYASEADGIHIKGHRGEFVIRDGSTEQLRLSPALAQCSNIDVRNEIVYIRQNSPEIFETGNFDEGQTQ